MYAVKEIYYTLQGEGAHTGRAAVFCRFAGCNLWSGREADRASAICQFCDTDFADTDGPGGGKFAFARELAAAVEEKWPASNAPGARFVVCTGGEPLLQLDPPLIDALHARGFEIAVETNGTIAAPRGSRLDMRQPQGRRRAQATHRRRTETGLSATGCRAGAFESLPFRHFFLQPMDGPRREANTQAALKFCLDHPRWRLSLQTHKLLGIP